MVLEFSSPRLRLFRHLFFDVDSSPMALTSSYRVYKYVRDVLHRKDISLASLKRFESTYVRPNQILRGYQGGKKKTLPYRAEGADMVWQADLADLHKPRGQRGTYAFILTVVDVFSRRGEAEPVVDKSARSVTRAFETICSRRGLYPVHLQSDKGKEFMNKTFAAFCKRKRIHHYYVSSPFKAALVERFNRQIQNMLWKYRRAYPSRSLKTLLTSAVRNYNDTPHRAHGLKPVDVVGETAVRLMYANLEQDRKHLLEAHKKPFRLKVGDKFRTTRERNVFSKGYKGLYTEEVFEVAARFRREPSLDINLYRLRDLIGRDIEKSVYYEFELQKVSLPARRQIRSTLRYDRRKGKKLVNFWDYPIDYVQWVRA